MAAAWNELPATGGLNECSALVRSAEALRVGAPELAVQFARRALLIGATDGSANGTNAGEARMLSMRAKAVLAAGLVRVSQHVNAVEPGFAALALAESGGAPDVAAEVRLDLAACAQELGEPLLGGALLRPVLETTQAPPSLRAAALGRLVGCVAHAARRDDVEDALAEADRLLAADDGLSPDARRMERARLAVRSAAYHRWYGDTEDAATAARDGLALLNRLRRELRAESDRLRARLVLELVCALLDDGELRDAEEAARPTVEEPVRATSAASVGQLMLAVATRVHLPSGQVDRGRGLLDQAAWVAERHGLDSVLADALTEVSRLDEQAGRTSDALTALRGARAAEQRRLRSMARAARYVLTEVGAGMGAKDVTKQAVAALLRQLAHPAGVPVAMAPEPAESAEPVESVEPLEAPDTAPKTAPKTTPTRAERSQRSQLPPPRTSPEPHASPPAGELTEVVDTDKGTGLLNSEGLVRRLRSVRKGERPVALTLVRFEPNNEGAAPDDKDRGPDTGIMAGLADKVRDLAPDNAELARPDGGELAVLLPDTTRDQAEEFAATVRETAIESARLANTGGKDMSISTGTVQGDDTQGDAAGMLTAARDALTPAQATGDTSLSETAAALSSALSEETPTRSRPTPQSALTDEPRTTPFSAAGGPDALTVGRSILSSLSIPSGSGGRRRAEGGEPPPGSKTRWPAEPAEAPRWTRAERRAKESATWPTDPTPTPPSGWPAEPDISQPLRLTAEHTSRQEPDLSQPLTETPYPAELQAFGAPDNAAPALPQRRGKRRAPEPEDLTSATDQPQAPEPHTAGTDHQADLNGTALPNPLATFTTNAAPADQLATGEKTVRPGELRAFGTDDTAQPGTVSSPHSSDLGGPSTDRPAGEQTGNSNSPQPYDLAGSGMADQTAPEDATRRDLAGLGAEPAAGDHSAGASGATWPGELRAFGAEPAAGDRAMGPNGTVRPGELRGFGVESTAGDQVGASGAVRPGELRAFGAEPATSDQAMGASGTVRPGELRGFGAETTVGDRDAEVAAGADQMRPNASYPADNPPAGPAQATSAPTSAPAPTSAATTASSQAGTTAADDGRSTYEETRAELARMMSALNTGSLHMSPAQQSVPRPPEPDDMPEPPQRPDIPEPVEPDPIPPVPPEPAPGMPDVPRGASTRSGLMAAFDALTGPAPVANDSDDNDTDNDVDNLPFRAAFDAAPELPSRKPLKSWAELQSAAVIESPADDLFGQQTATRPRRERFKSSLGAAFEAFGQPEPPATPAAPPATPEQPKTAEQPKTTAPTTAEPKAEEPTYAEPLGPPTRPDDMPRRDRSDSTTIAGLLAEALAAYQSSTEEDEAEPEPPQAPDRFDTFLQNADDRQQSGVHGRHRSPE